MRIPAPSRRASRRPLPFLTLALVAAVACEDSVRYTQAEDEAAMALIASTWSEPAAGGLVLSLCEDVARSDAWEGPDCRLEHVVRGGGRALEHTESRESCGMGGCIFGVHGYVVGTLQGGSLATPVSVRGSVSLGDGYEDDPYALPWSLSVECEGAEPCSLGGTIGRDGSLALTLTGPGAAPGADHAMERSGDAACP